MFIKFFVYVVSHPIEKCNQSWIQAWSFGNIDLLKFWKSAIALVKIFRQRFLLEACVQRDWALIILIQLSQQFQIALFDIIRNGFVVLLLVFALDAFDHHAGASFLCSLRLTPIMLRFNMGVKCRIGEISFAASTLEITPFFILSRTPWCCLLQLNVIQRFFLHHKKYYNLIISSVYFVQLHYHSKNGTTPQK